MAKLNISADQKRAKYALERALIREDAKKFGSIIFLVDLAEKRGMTANTKERLEAVVVAVQAVAKRRTRCQNSNHFLGRSTLIPRH